MSGNPQTQYTLMFHVRNVRFCFSLSVSLPVCLSLYLSVSVSLSVYFLHLLVLAALRSPTYNHALKKKTVTVGIYPPSPPPTLLLLFGSDIHPAVLVCLPPIAPTTYIDHAWRSLRLHHDRMQTQAMTTAIATRQRPSNSTGCSDLFPSPGRGIFPRGSMELHLPHYLLLLRQSVSCLVGLRPRNMLEYLRDGAV